MANRKASTRKHNERAPHPGAARVSAGRRKAEPESRMVSVYDGRVCVGHVIARGPAGWEAYDADDRSCGVFGTQHAAASVLWRIAHGQARDRIAEGGAP